MSACPDGRESVALREQVAPEAEIARLSAELDDARDNRERAECMASIQSEAVQLAMDLLVTHPDLRGFFRGFISGIGLLHLAVGVADLRVLSRALQSGPPAPEKPE